MDYPLIIISDVLLCRVCFRGFAVLAVALRVITSRLLRHRPHDGLVRRNTA